MTIDEAQALLDRLNADDDAWPLGYESDGFQLEGWAFTYEGNGVWIASHWDRDWKTLT
jgi:hypothetical protein